MQKMSPISRLLFSSFNSGVTRWHGTRYKAEPRGEELLAFFSMLFTGEERGKFPSRLFFFFTFFDIIPAMAGFLFIFTFVALRPVPFFFL